MYTYGDSKVIFSLSDVITFIVIVIVVYQDIPKGQKYVSSEVSSDSTIMV